MMWRSIGVAVLITAVVYGGLGVVLVKAEQDNPLSEKPSIVLRQATGQIPAGDLQASLSELSGKAAELSAFRNDQDAALAGLQEANGAMTSVHQALIGRVERVEKAAMTSRFGQ